MSNQSTESVIVQVMCSGARKKIALRPQMTVQEAIEVCAKKFKYVNTSGYVLCLASDSSVMNSDANLWRYKLAFNDELELRPPNVESHGSVRAARFRAR